jgi:chromosome segregation ATPase
MAQHKMPAAFSMELLSLNHLLLLLLLRPLLQVDTVKAEYVSKLQAAEARVKDIEAARDEAKKQAAALTKELEDSKKTALKVCWGVSAH